MVTIVTAAPPSSSCRSGICPRAGDRSMLWMPLREALPYSVDNNNSGSSDSAASLRNRSSLESASSTRNPIKFIFRGMLLHSFPPLEKTHGRPEVFLRKSVSVKELQSPCSAKPYAHTLFTDFDDWMHHGERPQKTTSPFFISSIEGILISSTWSSGVLRWSFCLFYFFSLLSACRPSLFSSPHRERYSSAVSYPLRAGASGSSAMMPSVFFRLGEDFVQEFVLSFTALSSTSRTCSAFSCSSFLPADQNHMVPFQPSYCPALFWHPQ